MLQRHKILQWHKNPGNILQILSYTDLQKVPTLYVHSMTGLIRAHHLMPHLISDSPRLRSESDGSSNSSHSHTTSLKWGSDGELSDLDLQRILGLLSQVDPVAEALVAHRNDSAV